MEGTFYREYSHCLNREMDFRRFGDRGLPILAFPSQDGKSDNFNNFGMTDCVAEDISSGKIQIFCCDSIDAETWSDQQGDKGLRAWRQECWYHYLVDELVPRIHEITGWGDRLLTTGCSLGASHAANLFFRRPDLFDGVIGLSGLYSADYFFGGYMDENLYNNSPEHYLAGMPLDHPYIQLYNQRYIVLCCGRGAWEEEMIASQDRLREIFAAKGIHAWQDYWGEDVNHDWPWWRRQLPYFLAHYFDGRH